MNPFYEQVCDIVRQIPYGRVVSYGQIARMLGRPRAARLVGRAARCCREPLPWHRVVMADGAVAGGRHAPLRMALLREEGVSFLSNGNVNMEASRWPENGERQGIENREMSGLPQSRTGA